MAPLGQGMGGEYVSPSDFQSFPLKKISFLFPVKDPKNMFHVWTNQLWIKLACTLIGLRQGRIHYVLPELLNSCKSDKHFSDRPSTHPHSTHTPNKPQEAGTLALLSGRHHLSLPVAHLLLLVKLDFKHTTWWESHRFSWEINPQSKRFDFQDTSSAEIPPFLIFPRRCL